MGLLGSEDEISYTIRTFQHIHHRRWEILLILQKSPSRCYTLSSPSGLSNTNISTGDMKRPLTLQVHNQNATAPFLSNGLQNHFSFLLVLISDPSPTHTRQLGPPSLPTPAPPYPP